MQVQDLVGIVPWTFVATILNLFIQVYLIKRFLFKPINEILEKRKAQQIAKPFRYVEHTTFAVGLPPTYLGIPHDLLQDFVFFHSINFSVTVRPESPGTSIQK